MLEDGLSFSDRSGSYGLSVRSLPSVGFIRVRRGLSLSSGESLRSIRSVVYVPPLVRNTTFIRWLLIHEEDVVRTLRGRGVPRLLVSPSWEFPLGRCYS